MATNSSILAWRIPWTEEPAGLQSMVWKRVGTWLRDKHFNFLYCCTFKLFEFLFFFSPTIIELLPDWSLSSKLFEREMCIWIVHYRGVQGTMKGLRADAVLTQDDIPASRWLLKLLWIEKWKEMFLCCAFLFQLCLQIYLKALGLLSQNIQYRDFFSGPVA